MKISQANPARAAPYDRAALEIGRRFFSAGIGPHASTQRFTYTVPAGKKCLVESVQAMYLRETVAAPVGLFSALVQVNLLAVTAIDLATTISLNNTVGATDRAIVAPQSTIIATSLLQAFTADAGTGGAVTYLLTAKALEFNA